MIPYNIFQTPLINERQLLCLVNLETFELPICLSKVGRVVGHEIRAAPRAVVQFCIEQWFGTQRTAQVNIGNDALIGKVRWDITVGAGKIRQCSSPR